MVLYPVDYLLTEEDWPRITKNELLQSERITQNTIKAQCCQKEISTADGDLIKSQHLNYSEEDENLLQLFTLECADCNKTVAVWIGQWCSIETILQSNDISRNNFCQVTTLGEYLVLWTLNSVLFGQYENENEELEYLPIFRDEFARIYWRNGVAAGFYTVKRKGMNYCLSQLDSYCMPIIDLIFVRKSYRRSGIGFAILLDVINLFPNQDIGLSAPISDSMLKVLCKFLKQFPENRALFWETLWTGCEGFRKNVWFTISRKFTHSRSV